MSQSGAKSNDGGKLLFYFHGFHEWPTNRAERIHIAKAISMN
jgi:hypothetical protein